jgi:hypothetical protein
MEERYRNALRATAWSEFVYPRPAINRLSEPTPSATRAFAIYEAEINSLSLRITRATQVVQEMLGQLVSGPEREDAQAILDALTGADQEDVG